MDNYNVQTCVPAELEKKIFMLRCGALDINSAEAREMVGYMIREERTARKLRWALLDAVETLQKQVDNLRKENGVLRTANANLRAENSELHKGARKKPRIVHREAG